MTSLCHPLPQVQLLSTPDRRVPLYVPYQQTEDNILALYFLIVYCSDTIN